jgi:putative transposase
MYAGEWLKSEIIQEAIEKVVKPSQPKEMALAAVLNKAVSMRLACQAFGVSQTCYLYQAKLFSDNSFIADWLEGFGIALTP